MSRKVALFVIALGLATKLFAQEANVSSIVPSSAPAFTVLGISPTEISKPNSWSALQAAAYQSLASGNGASDLLKNFALEIKPYWLSSHPKFTYNDYLNANGFSLRNLSISVASARTPYGRDSAQSMGFGFRLPIMTAHTNRAKIQAKLSSYMSMNEQAISWESDFDFYVTTFNGNTVQDLIDSVNAKLKTPPARPTFWKNYGTNISQMLSDTLQQSLAAISSQPYAAVKPNIKRLIEGYYSKINRSRAQSITDSISAALKNVSNWEISGALSLAFPTNQFTYSRFSNAGIWSDYSFNIAKNWQAYGTAAIRYLRAFRADSVSASDNFDAIFRFNYAFDQQQKFTVSAWGVLRRSSNALPDMVINNITYTASKGAWDNKYGVDISYKISDQVAVSYSFGKNYKHTQSFSVQGGNQLISFLNLFYSINTKVKQQGSDYVFKSF